MTVNENPLRRFPISISHPLIDHCSHQQQQHDQKGRSMPMDWVCSLPFVSFLPFFFLFVIPVPLQAAGGFGSLVFSCLRPCLDA